MGVCTLYVDFIQNKLIFHGMGYPMMMMMRMIKGMTQRVWANDSIFIVTLRQRTTTTTATKYITTAESSTTKTCFCVYSSLSVFFCIGGELSGNMSKGLQNYLQKMIWHV